MDYQVKEVNGYYCFVFSSGRRVFLHTLIANFFNRSEKKNALKSMDRSKNKFLVVHHIDFNKKNNHPDNLLWIGENDHFLLHSELIYRVLDKNWSDEEYRSRMREFLHDCAIKLWYHPDCEESRMRRNKGASESMLKKWQEDEYREKVIQAQIKGRSTPEAMGKFSRSIKEYWESDEGLARKEYLSDDFSKRSRSMWENPEYRDQVVTRSKEKWNDPEYREKMTSLSKENMTERWKDPEFQNKISGKRKEMWDDPSFRSNMRRSKAINTGVMILNKGITLTPGNYTEHRYRNSPGIDLIISTFGSFEEFIKEVNNENSKKDC